jgi:hypothetical protein
MILAGHGEKRNAYKFLVGNPEGRKQLGRSRHRWKDNTKMDLREIRWGGMVWIYLDQNRDQWRALMDELLGSIKCWEILE